ncbi:MAG TPA: outer membrane protein assembly factor BamA [Porphyromonadaceae bacterium]|jgi:outer membrane protein insertion porin family|nr:outer membrane protein assembly factor BamA [Porphyromonadaceae bacterium]HBL34695.1 outer membrane protein assembly factor BamA [Porphyromonadaceae bacterium]HBX21957.1 outer membrane protein assembly factor BamA [Porphyromonadaceae bacterium]HCM22438.1 outer membrane protein assembly factor BamA [Porphyromonadaceae bacterium]
MLKKTFYLVIALTFFLQIFSFGQVVPSENALPFAKDSINKLPVKDELVVNYMGTPKKYIIADIDVTGVEGTMYEDQEFVLVGFSGLAKGQEIQIPGDDISNAVQRFWKQGLFSDIKIVQTKIDADSVWLEIRLTDRPRVADIQYTGMKKSEQKDIDQKIQMVKGNQITPHHINRAKEVIKSFFAEKGFGEADVNILQHPVPNQKNQVILEIAVDKKEKLKVNRINIEGNEALTDNQLKWAMKKTNEKGKLRNLFRSKKFVDELYVEDKNNLITKYHEKGYRDAEILKDTVYKHDDKSVNIDLVVEEGPLYHIRSVNWIGNTQFNSLDLDRSLNMHSGDVYDQKKLQQRLKSDEDAAINIYQNNGYLFSDIDPVEINIENDSVDLELRVTEGPKATIKKVIIQGNDRLYEDVIRRELRTKPGEVFSKDLLIRSIREIAQTGHFDPENLQPDVQPDPEDGTVNIGYPLTSKGNDQIEFSAGWGVTGLVGKLSLKLNNFSLKNMLNPKLSRGIIPQGEGQTLVLSAQTNGDYYQAYQFSFMEPWFGGKRPNNFSISAYYSRYTGLNQDYYSNSMSSYYNPYMYSSYGGYGGGYGNYGSYYQDMSQFAYDPNQVFSIIGVSVGYGKRLEWPDDYFSLQGELGYQRYNLKNWTYNYFPFQTGSSNSLTLNLSLSRSSIDNPLYTRTGSQFSLSVTATPPFSLWDGKDYKKMAYADPAKYTWNEYHKWKFKARTFTPLTPLTVKRTPVIATRVEFGFLGDYNSSKQTPFETFDMGGSGMTGYTTSFATEIVALRGYEENSVGQQARAYSRFGVELRYPFILEPNSTIYGLAFVEAGNAWLNLKNFNPFDLKRSAGVGARIFLPMIGLLGIDWAYGFDTVYGTGARERGGSQLHFIIGQEF